ncbi:hypothetical protein SAMN04487905_112164 [Actinopolyspora xinjiangensis]|uniref:Uncharacterized protein n=1 Tax=Actinopolyspora xinjiangensis TaxID=405564 RepID=A0A1H0WJ52_9ACTN|nr:hypothetical protein SAMN04487905_112164 [Actinopolyspora xinjiangensis]
MLTTPACFALLGLVSTGYLDWPDRMREVAEGVTVIAEVSAPVVLFPGLPLALLTERICARARLPLTLLAFALAGVVAGFVASFLILYDPLFYSLAVFVVPFAVLSAVLGRAFAGPVARRPGLCWVLVLIVAAVSVLAVLGSSS